MERNFKIINLILIGVVCLLLIGCEKRILNINSIYGKYISNGDSLDYIYLKENGKFFHINKQDSSFENNGLWNYDTIFNEVIFSNFIFYGDTLEGVWISKLFFDKNNLISLNLNRDAGLYYYKK